MATVAMISVTINATRLAGNPIFGKTANNSPLIGPYLARDLLTLKYQVAEDAHAVNRAARRASRTVSLLRYHAPSRNYLSVNSRSKSARTVAAFFVS